MNRRNFLIGAGAVLAGCKLDKDHEKRYELTPDGYRVRRVGAWNSDRDAAFTDFDYAVKRAGLELEQTEGIPYADVLGWAHQLGFDLYDHLFFTWKGGFYHGLYWPTREPEVWAAYWPYGVAPDEATAIALADQPWTVYHGTTTGKWYYGIYNAALMYPVLSHELAWRWGISHKAGKFGNVFED